MTTNPDLNLARKWAKDPSYQSKEIRAAAEVINALPDEWIDANKLREVINGQLSRYPHGTAGHHAAEEIACKLEPFFPDPQPRTLGDMTPEEREACQWMQADFRDRSAEYAARVVITRANQHVTDVVFPSGVVSCVYNDELTLLPDLPRMVWPEVKV